MMSSPQDIPAHAVRESHRARRVHLRYSVARGLEVVVPPGFDRSEIPALLSEKARWIDRARREIEAQRALCDPTPRDVLPQRLLLRALDEEWEVEARQTAAARLSLRETASGRLVVAGPVDDTARWRSALKRWLARRAVGALATWVDEEARNHGFRKATVSVRWQRARWGSCSRRAGTREPVLSLNAGLLFLPPNLVRYVILHELCHTERMDHSPAFWRKLGRVEPRAAALREELRAAWHLVPAWLEPAHSPDGDVDDEGLGA